MKTMKAEERNAKKKEVKKMSEKKEKIKETIKNEERKTERMKKVENEECRGKEKVGEDEGKLGRVAKGKQKRQKL